MPVRAPAHPTKAHKYLRVTVKGRTSVNKYKFRCVHPGCQHYLTNEFIVGAIAECWRCGDEFVIDKVLALKKPHCRPCTKRKDLDVEESRPPIPESPL